MFSILRKHLGVLGASWAEESKARKTKKEYRQHDFLPAALEILEKPPSPVGRAVGWSIVAFFTIAVGWSILGRIDVVASASGKTLPRQHVKVIQPMELGAVRKIYVTDGQVVRKGDPLIDLDPTNANSDEAQAQQQYLVANVEVARNKAILDYIDGGEAIFSPSMSVSDDVKAMQENLITAEINEYQARLGALQMQRGERQAELSVMTRELAKLHEMLPLVAEQVSAREELAKEGYTPRLLLLEHKERYISMIKDAQITRDQITRVRASINATGEQTKQVKEEFRVAILADIAEAEARAEIAAQDLTRTKHRQTMQSLVAPVDGVVQQLAVHTLGGIVQPAEPVMVIVPGDGELIAEVLIANKDIGFVSEGNDVEIKLEAFPFTRFGVVDGTLEDISNDAIQDERLGLVYKARVKLHNQTIRAEGRNVILGAGMSATAEIKTGKRRVIEFIMSPLLRYKDEALRER